MLKIIFFALLTFLLLPSILQAAGIGAILKNDYEFVKRGETSEFVVLLWSMEESTPVKVSIRQAPKDWNIVINPREFILNRSSDGSKEAGAEYVSVKGVTVKSTPVKIFVSVPKNSDLGEHVIIITATVGEPQDGMSFLLEKNFRLVVNVTTPFGNSETESKNATNAGENVFTGLTAVFEGTNLITLLIPIVAIAAISWVVYKRV